ncbi:hypothetical protein RD792_016849 [Penstemon davidsonii]|uniref:Uncharacterized protein n=1 Tax=Penstemon davidsonii TaxID=160366 RepID=A0ABR0CM79_9LAMI|nr:hypothetical protein RD792_016849 [Penstemon davidsonii]
MVADKRPRIEADVDGESSQLEFEDLVYSVEKIQQVQDEIDKFLNHPKIGVLRTDEDQKILKHVDSLYVEEFKDIRMGYCITVNFKRNPYFENTKLTKTIRFFNDGTMTATGTTIIWKEGKGLVDVSGDAQKGNKRSLSEERYFLLVLRLR